MVEREPSEIFPQLPRLRPFDVSVLFDHMLDEDVWRSDLKMLRIDITIVPPTTELKSSISQTARFKELFLRLREGEEKKFCRDGKRDKENDISYSGDEIMGIIERDNMVLVPATFTPHGHTGPLFNRLIHGHNTEPLRIFRNRPNANICEDSARSFRVPHDML